MLTRLSLVRPFMLKKLGQRGAMFVEYALILAFIVVVGALFTSDSGLADSIKSIFESVQGLLGKGATNAQQGS